MRFYYFILLVSLALCCSVIAHTMEDLARWSRSDDWHVRYCVPMEIRVASPEAKRVLEQLSTDENRGVASQAFEVYSRLFVDVNKDIARKAFDRGNFALVGIEVPSLATFSTTEFWLKLAESSDDSSRGRSVRAVGLLHDSTALPKLSNLKDSKNVYVLLELAKAFRRLGSDEKYLATLDLILTPPITDKASIYYRTLAVDCLLQTHPKRVRAAWDRNDQELSRITDLQPNWVFAHVTQKERLP